MRCGERDSTVAWRVAQQRWTDVVAKLSARQLAKLPAREFGLPEKARTVRQRRKRATTRCRTRAAPSAPSGIAEAAQGRKPHQGRVDRINRKADRVQGKRTDPIASVRPGPLVGGADLLAELLQLQHPRAERLELIR